MGSLGFPYDIDMCQFLPDIKVKYENVREFKGPVQIVKNIPNKGRGIIATDDISQGQLIFVSKAFETDFGNPSCDSLEDAIAEKLSKYPDLRHEFYELHAGEVLGHISPPPTPPPEANHTSSDDDSDTPDPVDDDRIINICQVNHFKTLNGSRGIWILPAYINHDCIDFNCIWVGLGDLVFVRAIRKINKGEELLTYYKDSLQRYQNRLKVLETLDFVCECRLCQYQGKEFQQNDKKKSSIILRGHNFLSKNRDKIDLCVQFVNKSIQDYQQICETSKKPEWDFGIFELLDMLRCLYIRSGDIQGQKVTAERHYKVVSGCDQKDGRRTICFEIGAAGRVAELCLQLGDLIEAKKWIGILKNDLTLLYGKSNVLKYVEPELYFQATQYAIGV